MKALKRVVLAWSAFVAASAVAAFAVDDHAQNRRALSSRPFDVDQLAAVVGDDRLDVRPQVFGDVVVHALPTPRPKTKPTNKKSGHASTSVEAHPAQTQRRTRPDRSAIYRAAPRRNDPVDRAAQSNGSTRAGVPFTPRPGKGRDTSRSRQVLA